MLIIGWLIAAVLLVLAWFTPRVKTGGGARRMFVQGVWMEKIADGSKRVEGRAGPRNKFAWMIGKDVEFFNNKLSAVRRIADIRHYDTLDEYLAAEWKLAAPHLDSIDAAREAYLAIRDKKGRQVFGELSQGMNAIVFAE